MPHAGRAGALAVVIGLLATVEIWRSHRQATLVAERVASSFTRVLAEQTEHTIQAVDLTLIGMRDALLVAPHLPPNASSYRSTLLQRLKRLPYVRALFVIGPDGFITHDTDYPRTPRVSLADRPYFQAHRDDPSDGLRIGKPLRSRSVGVWFISMSRRINTPDGSFGGIVVAAVEPRYFKRFYKDLTISDGSVIALLHRDGTLLARVPRFKATIGTSYTNGPIRKLLATRDSGVAWIESPVDGTRRIAGYRTLAGAPLVVSAGWSVHSVYAAWRDHAAVVGIGAILVWLLASSLTLLWFEHRRRGRLEEGRLAQVQRLEILGRIAGGIAHDLGNTVKIARTTFALLKPSLTSQSDAMALVEEADRSLKSAFDIIDRLLTFARRQELRPRDTDMAELISGFAPILRQAAGPDIQLDLDVRIAKPLVCAIDPIHLESALLNLVLNSRDAMPDGGRIVIEVRMGQPPHRRGRRQERMPAMSLWAEVVVRDDGTGMPPDVLERAFEPFFTTRKDGSGLGLSQVLGFVQQNTGVIRIASREGDGTTVRLLFPAASDATDVKESGRPGLADDVEGKSDSRARG